MYRVMAFLGLLLLSTNVLSDVRFASWNIKHFGWNNNKADMVVAGILSGFDLVAIQELMDPETLDRLEVSLERLTGDQWSSLSSTSAGRGSYREHYGFLWRDRQVSYVDGAVSYIDRRDVFIREPFSARFLDKDSGKSFAVGTVHILFGDSVSDRVGEINALKDYWDWMEEVYSEDRSRLILAGDFNLAPDHRAWSPLKKSAKPLITRGGTTLSKKNGVYASLYDNIWISRSSDMDHRISGIFRLPEWMESITGRAWSNAEIRDRISDHVPVFTLIGAQDIPTLSVEGHSTSLRDLESSASALCVDLNAADPSQLESIPYVGPERSEMIVSGRPWASVEGLVRIKGIGKATVRKIKSSGVVCEI